MKYIIVRMRKYIPNLYATFRDDISHEFESECQSLNSVCRKYPSLYFHMSSFDVLHSLQIQLDKNERTLGKEYNLGGAAFTAELLVFRLD